MSSFLPESAPFSQEQRAWLNGFFSGLMGIQPGISPGDALAAAGIVTETIVAPPDPQVDADEDFPWHDSALPIADRMELAEGKPLKRKLMAAMAQLDCGSCGYLCETYSEAIASGEESNLTLCSPGGKETKQMIKKLLKENGSNENDHEKRASNGVSITTLGWSRQNPLEAKLIESRPLNSEGSAKDTRHVVIDLSGSDLKYHVGDALGVYPTNCGELAAMIIDRIAADAHVPVQTPLGNSKPLRQALCEDCCLKDPSEELLELVLAHVSQPDAKQTLKTMLDEGVPEGFDVLDVLQLGSCSTLTATEVIETLEPLNPRLYSIASSMKKVGDQVHLTVGKVSYEREGRVRKGVASTMLADRLDPGASVRVFPQPNHGGFTVPKDSSKPIIMVGPGTGIAPFMAFLQERDATKSTGKNWLFFGDQHEAFDFLYQEELKNYHETGLLTNLDVAFSRDGDQKVYVQDRMREKSAELWQWLQDGACFFVCGDASRMATDVDRALKDIVAKQGNMSEGDAKAYVEKMSADQRYVRDVY
jgi:sulfite reductase (NADPH) flavoprotein alpha-component